MFATVQYCRRFLGWSQKGPEGCCDDLCGIVQQSSSPSIVIGQRRALASLQANHGIREKQGFSYNPDTSRNDLKEALRSLEERREYAMRIGPAHKTRESRRGALLRRYVMRGIWCRWRHGHPLPPNHINGRQSERRGKKVGWAN
jgi:hypothetical protein